MMALHNTGDVYINASRGEGWCLPLTTAMGMGKTIISGKHTATKDYITYNNAYNVPHTKTPCYGHMDTLPNLSHARQNWFEVDVDELAHCIKCAYLNDRAVRERGDGYNVNASMGAAAMKTIFDKYGYESVGNIIRDLLNETK